MSAGDAKLREVQLSLAEVIDEYLVLEQERDGLRTQCACALGASDSLAQAVQAVTRYTTIMEAAVVAAMPALQQKGDMSATQWSPRAVPPGKATAPAPSEALLFVGELAAQMQQVEADVNALFQSLDAAKRQLEPASSLTRGGQALPGALSTASPSTATVSGSEAIQLRREARLRATEMTVASLNTELASWQQRYAHLRDRAEREREAALQEASREVHTLRAQLDESDAVLGRLSHELETLIDENARLKQQLRAVQSAAHT